MSPRAWPPRLRWELPEGGPGAEHLFSFPLDFPFAEQSPSRKDVDSQPQFPLRLPCVGALPQLSGHRVSKFGMAPQPASGTEPGTALTQRAKPSEALAPPPPGLRGQQAGKQRVMEDALQSGPGTDEHARSHRCPQGRRAQAGVSASERAVGTWAVSLPVQHPFSLC